jgi:hypothetical protein
MKFNNRSAEVVFDDSMNLSRFSSQPLFKDPLVILKHPNFSEIGDDANKKQLKYRNTNKDQQLWQ